MQYGFDPIALSTDSRDFRHGMELRRIKVCISSTNWFQLKSKAPSRSMTSVTVLPTRDREYISCAFFCYLSFLSKVLILHSFLISLDFKTKYFYRSFYSEHYQQHSSLILHTKPSSTSFTYDNYAILYDSPYRFLSGGLHFG